MKYFTRSSLRLLVAAMAVGSCLTVHGQDASLGLVFPSQTSVYSNELSLRVDDAVLGEHDGGTDNRAKAFVVSAWVMFDAKVSSGQLNYTNIPLFGIAAENAFGVTTNADVCLNNGGFVVKHNASQAGTPTVSYPVGSTSNVAQSGQWVHLAMCVDDNEGVLRLYINGKEAQELSYDVSTPVLRSGEDLVFHLTNAYSYSSIPTTYDDLKVTNRALTDKEMAEMTFAYSKDLVPDYIAAYYSFDETSGTTGVYPNLGYAGDYPAQVMEGMPGYSGMDFSGTLSSTDLSCEGHENSYWAPTVEEFAVTVEVEGDGGVVLTDGGGSVVESGSMVEAGTQLNVAAYPGKYYELSGITVNDEPLGGTSFVVDEETLVKVMFTRQTATVAVDEASFDGGSVELVDAATDAPFEAEGDGNEFQVPMGTEVKVLATPDGGWRLDGIGVETGDGLTALDLDNPVFTVETDGMTVVATFVQQHKVTFDTDGDGGSLVVSAGDVQLASGDVVDDGTRLTVEVVPDDGFVLEYLRVNGDDADVVDGRYEFTVEDDVVIEAKFGANGLDAVAAMGLHYDGTGQCLVAGSECAMSVFALDGSQVASGNGSRLDVGALDGGIYVARVVAADGTVVTIKFQKR